MIINRARKDLLKEKIRGTINKIDRLNTQMNDEMDDFIQQFPTDRETQATINTYLKYTHEQEFEITKARQLRKLKKIIEKKNNDKHRHPEINEKWMRNLSQRTLTETEKKVLTRGLNYVLTPGNIPYEEYVLATELASQKIQDQGKKAELRNAVAGILKSAKLPVSNISKAERATIDSQKRQNHHQLTSRQRQDSSSYGHKHIYNTDGNHVKGQ